MQKLRRNHEALFRLLVEHMGCGLVVEDYRRNIILANQAICDIFSIPEPPEELCGEKSSGFIEQIKLMLVEPDLFTARLAELVAAKQAVYYEEVRFADGRVFWQDYTPVLEEDNSVVGHMWQYWEITERKQIEERLKYLSLHDQLTGLYNRAYFENELSRLSKSREFPVTILSADLDGLKLINDALGHHRGDSYLKACTKILKTSLRGGDVLSRVGGDEFAALLPRTGYDSGEQIVNRIYARVDQYNRNRQAQLPLSISIGQATAQHGKQSLNKTLKEADEHMYRIKLHKGVDARAQMIKTLLATLGERDMITEGHARRLENFCRITGEKIKLSSKQLSDLVLLSQVHDLGKVGVPDRVLFKTGPLNNQELSIMHLHCEKGYRIALSSTGLSGIADLILKHHERWDGSGYPLGIQGKEIPVECRILAIVDAYDAMTTDRPYRKAMSKQAAVAELKRCSGRQFDPELVQVFLSVLKEYVED